MRTLFPTLINPLCTEPVPFAPLLFMDPVPDSFAFYIRIYTPVYLAVCTTLFHSIGSGRKLSAALATMKSKAMKSYLRKRLRSWLAARHSDFEENKVRAHCVCEARAPGFKAGTVVWLPNENINHKTCISTGHTYMYS